MAPSFLTFFDPSKIEWARAFPPRSVAHTLLETVCVTNFFQFKVAHTVLGTFKLLYRLTLFQPLYTCAYLQLLRSGGCTKTCSGGCQVGGFESKALPVKNYCYIQMDTGLTPDGHRTDTGRTPDGRSPYRVTYGGSTLPKKSFYYGYLMGTFFNRGTLRISSVS
jgi:hypothetical protein